MYKVFQRTYAIIMTLILAFQYIGIGSQVYAVTTSAQSGTSIRLESVKADPENANQYNLKVDLPTATADSDYQISLNSPLAFKTADEQATKENSSVTYVTEKNDIKLTAKAGSQGEVTIPVTLDSSSIGNTSKIELTYQDQKVSADLTQATSSTSSAASSSVASSSSASVAKPAARAPRIMAANDAHDISQYLPASDNGTIIDSADITVNGSPLVDGQSLNASDRIDIAYTWSIPNDLLNGYQLQAGDTFSFQLPSNITYRPNSTPLPAGPYVNYTIDNQGKVTFTFTDQVEGHSDISGTFNYNQSQINVNVPGTTTIDIPVKSGDQTTHIVVNPTGGHDISKAGSLSAGPNPKQAIWDVTINTDGQQLDDATVTDPMPAGTTLSNTAVYPLTIDMNGHVTATGAALVPGTDYTVDANGTVQFSGTYAHTHQAFKIEYTTNINSSAIPDDGGTVTFTNQATLTNNGKDYTASASVSPTYGGLLAKGFDGTDGGSQKYKWHVDYNFGEKSLPAGTTLTDSLVGDQVYTGTPTLTYRNGGTVPASDYKITYDSSNKQMTITFPNGLNSGIVINYDSQVTTPINGSTSISNNVTSNNKTATSGGNTVGEEGLTKGHDHVDYNNKTLQWHLNINDGRQEMHGYTLTDTMSPAGLTIVPGSYVLHDNVTNTDVAASNYTIAPTSDGFKITFIGSLAVTSDNYTLTYTTGFNGLQLPANGQWTNSADATWVDRNGATHKNHADDTFQPHTPFVSDGTKSGSYNAQTKHITWTVIANYNQIALDNASISDDIIGDQDYVAGSAQLYEATINSSNGQAIQGALVNSANITYTPAADTTGGTQGTLTAILPSPSSKTYILTYETSLTGKVIDQDSYDNTAKYTNGQSEHDLTASVSVPNSGSYVAKTGEQDTTDSAYAKWYLGVNESQSTVHNVTLVDHPSTNQIIDPNSIAIYGANIDANGVIMINPGQANQHISPNLNAKLTEGVDYTVDLQTDQTTGVQTMTIKFLHEISTAYAIEYRALINSSRETDTLDNSVTATADGEKTVNQPSSQSISVANSSGTSQGKNVSLQIVKTDQDSGTPLAGAKFELWSISNGQKGMLLRSGTTDASGQITWGSIKSGNYLLFETQGPTTDGYIVPADLISGRRITVPNTTTDNTTVTQSVTNQKGTVTLTKTDADTSSVLPGAIFSLYSANGNLIQAGLTTNKNGQLTYSGLDAGSYYFVETAAPAGYNLDSSHHNFTLDSSHITTNVNVSDSETSGSVILYKTDSDTNQALQGAVFQLFQANGTQVGGDRTTDAAGTIQVGDLKPGNYYFKEIAAPAGYTLGDTTQYDFSIVLGQQSTAVIVNAGNAEKRGSLVMNKTDADTNQPLQGAIFSIYRVGNAQPVLSNQTTDANGQFTANGLLPGNYYYVETKAPDGYVLDGSHHNFTIAFNQVTSLGVSAQNTKKTGSARVAKTDADTNKPLAGAYFDLYQADGNLVQSNLRTGDDGYATVSNLKPGDYYFKETYAPAGYSLDSTKQYAFTIDFNPSTTDVKTVAVANAEKRGSVILTKKSSNGQNLAGAVFEIRKASDDSVVASNLTTDSDGRIRKDDLLPGDYYFVETKAPDGYVLNTVHTPFTITFNPTSTPATASETNYKGSATLTKTDAQGNPLKGAIFKVVDKDGNDVQTGLTSGADGKITVTDLAPGDYSFVETQAPDGYVLNTNKTDFTIAASAQNAPAVVNASSEFMNYQGTATLTKTDAKGNPLQGAVFKVVDKNGKDVQTGLTSNEQGIVTATNLAPGQYEFVETQAPDGYVLNTTGTPFTIHTQAAGQPAVVNAASQFINYKGSAQLTKTDATGQPLQGAIFKVVDKDGKDVQTGLHSDAQGKVTVTDLAPGQYLFYETQAPTGYVLNTTGTPFTIHAAAKGEPAIVTVAANFVNYQGKAQLIKTDKDGKPLAGATFEVRNKAGQVVASNLTSDNQGVVSVDKLAPGQYEFVETQAPAGYILNTTGTPFTIHTQAKGEPTIVTASDEFINYKGSAQLTKTDSQGNPLVGAEFKVVDKQGKDVQTGLISDKDGHVTVDNLAPGQYEFYETKAPAGYVLNTTGVPFMIHTAAKGEPAVVKVTENFVNYQGSATLTKKDEAGNPLSGAIFKVVDKNGKDVQTGLTTGSDGKVTVANLAPGQYIFYETQAPIGYVLNKTGIAFTIHTAAKGQPVQVDASDNFINYQGSATLTKVSANGTKLAGAEFKVVDSKGNTVISKLVSDEAGKVTATHLAPGDYSFVETKAPDGYVLNTNPTSFTIAASAKGQPQVVVASEGFINYKGSAQLTKVDAKGNPLAGAIFKVVDKNGKDVQTNLTSDATGVVKVDNLAPGQYIFYETQAPAGYVLNTVGTPFTIHTQAAGQPATVDAGALTNYKGSATITKTDSQGNPLAGAVFKVVDKNGKDVQTNLTSDAKGLVTVTDLAPGQYIFYETQAPDGYVLNTTATPFTIHTQAAGQPAVVNASSGFINYKGSVTLTKTDAKGNPLAGAVFKIVDKQGNDVQTNLTSDAEGKVSATNLAPGQYILYETTAPDGYILNSTGTPFTIHTQAKGEPEVVNASSQFINYKGSAQLTKTDSKGNPLAGAEFTVVDKDGQVVKTGLVSDAQGHVSIDNLAPGQYIFYETKAPEGYILNKAGVPFIIHTAAKGEPAIVKVASNFVNYQGTAELTKTDAQGNPLAGATFKVIDKDGKDVQTGLISDAKGHVTVTDLKPGDYSFVETQAPKGYILNTTKADFTIAASAKGQPVTVKMPQDFVNYQGSAVLTKTDAQGNPLAGAEFKLVDQTGRTIKSGLVSGKDGLVKVDHLAPGKYQFIETKAPAGYKLNGKAVSFVIGDQAAGKPETVNAGKLVNYKKPSATAFSNGHNELPNTGEQVIWFSTISGTLIAISAAEAWLLKRKRHED
ncbi:MAG: SpaA isopeptide-forming pilin-related protein [Oenococcus sp.]|uniref:SpaA isopeptide-forming pilin-related protein n=1 Tax=Oenococcus TaxID=46254 RepID=UPI0021E7339B|nr:SpaA isopeptide-forming pilin-related protein [Oenococcus kitaharae]MCV3296559.1 SpaA isopeptide-forming pilin-related protein [Oenococcus kitaharae]